MTILISDNAEEFRIEISGCFSSSAVAEAATAWKAALLANTPRQISIDINRMTSYDHGGYLLLREAHSHGTLIVAGSPRSLQFFDQISGPEHLALGWNGTEGRKRPGKKVIVMQPRASASGE